MIQLTREEKPSYLTDEKVKELTSKYKSEQVSVWNKQQIKLPLLTSSNNKCAYCECKLQQTDSYCQIEHFHPKSLYPDEVIDWNNLLPSCGRCNSAKLDHDTIVNPIVNPYKDLPSEHLTIEACRLYSKTKIGQTTIDVLDLNDIRLCIPRFELCNKVNENLENIKGMNDLIKQRNQLKNLLITCSKIGEFSAFCSQTLHANRDYSDIQSILKRQNYWNGELDKLDQETLSIALEPR